MTSGKSPVYILMFCFSLLIISSGQAQNVSINNDGAAPDPSAMLDVKSTTQGLLIPRMTQAQRLAIPSPADGLIVFQIDGASGLYIHDGSLLSWIHQADSNDITAILGSISIDSTRIADSDGNTKIQVEEGPNDNVIRFDIAGSEIYRMQGRRIHVTNTGNSIYIGENAGNNDNSGDRQNVAIGALAMEQNTGSFHVAVGRSAGRNGTTGFGNVIVGESALFSNTTGSTNTAVGWRAGILNTNANNNTIIGADADYFNTNGSNNTIIGYQAGRGSATHTKSGNIFIGRNAGFNEITSNKLYIENSGSNTPLIYGNFAIDSVKINGVLAVDSAKNGSGYAFPGADGTAGQVMTTNGAGRLGWSSIAAGGSQWTLSGGVVFPNSTNSNFAVGATSVTAGYKGEIVVSTGPLKSGLLIRNEANGGGADFKRGVTALLTSAGNTGRTGFESDITGNGSSADTIRSFYSVLRPQNTGAVSVGLRSEIKTTTGTRYGVYSTGESFNYFQGRIGIGDPNPGVSLAINTISNNDGLTLTNLNNNNTLIRFFEGSTVKGIIQFYGTTDDFSIGTTTSSNSLLLETNSTPRITIRSNGNVGIGVTNPNNQLEVNGVGIFRATSGISRPAVTHIAISPTSSVNYIESANGLAPRPLVIQSSDLTINTGNISLGQVQAMHINNAGQVGIGTTNPTAPLEVNGDIEIPATSDYTYSSARTKFQSYPAHAFQLLNSGNTLFNSIGIGGTTQGTSIWVAGGNATQSAQLFAPVYLPDGAIVTNVEFFVVDNDIAYEVAGFLRRTQNGTDTWGVMAETNTSGIANSSAAVVTLSDNTIASPIIDNNGFTYYLAFNTRQALLSMRLIGARITYTVQQAD